MNMKYLGILLFSLLFVACGKDEVCTAATFASNYSADGTICSITGGNKLVITSTGESISLVLSGTGGELKLSNIAVTSCTFNSNIEDTKSNTKMTLVGTLNGKNLTLAFTGTFLGQPINCTEKWKK